MNKYKLVYKGKDYSAIPDYSAELDRTKPLDFVEIRDIDDKLVELDNFPLKNCLTDILISFLDSFDEKTLSNTIKNIDENEDEEKNAKKKKLYTKLPENKYMFNGLVGFLRKKDFSYNFFNVDEPSKSEKFSLDISLRCTSRFDDDSNKSYFLCSMLLRNNLSFVDSLVPTDDNDDMFEYMLLFRYIYLLRESFVKGFYKKYVTFQNNDDHLRGSIDIARYLRLNCGYDNGKIAYSYRENTVVNPLNMLIIEAYKKLKNNFSDLMETCFTRDDEDIINALCSEIGYINYSISDLIKLNAKPIYHPYYFEYESLREICLKILRDEGMNLFAQEEIDEASGFLVYIPNLWEKYLEYQFKQIDIWNVEAQYRKEVAISTETRIPAMIIIPDFVFKDSENLKMMIDAKFKPMWYAATRDNKKNLLGIEDEDVRKCISDMTLLHMPKTGVIFPVLNDEVFKTYEINDDSNFYAVGVKVPTTKNEKSFYSWNACLESNVAKQIKEKLLPIFNENK